MIPLIISSVINDDKDNKYTLTEVIGQGGFGIVFKAVRKSDNKLFAVKTLPTTYGSKNEIASFLNEMRLAVKVNAVNVIKYEYISDLESEGETPPFIIMEFAEGGTLSSYLEEKTDNNDFLQNDELIAVYKQLINGMKAVNETMVHRDIKPDNILISSGKFKISDFGLAKIASEATRTQTFKGGGTLLYMAPEAFDLTKNSIEMDIYSMGIVFYQLATLKYPYSPEPSSYETAKNAHLLKPVTSASSYNKDLSPAIVSVINRMLSKKSTDRFPSWDEILSAIEKGSSSNQISSIALSAISKMNSHDDERQREISAANIRQKEKDEFCQLVFSQFDNMILQPIRDFIDQFNGSYSGSKKFRMTNFNLSSTYPSEHPRCFCEIITPLCDKIKIEATAIIENSFKRDEPCYDVFSAQETHYGVYSNSHRQVSYTPTYNYKNKSHEIQLFAEISSNIGGFNILLLKTSEIYGDWLIRETNWTSENADYDWTKMPLPYAVLLKDINKFPITRSHQYGATIKKAYIEYDFSNELLEQKIVEISNL
jgi:serine/threonine protein kinase